MQINLQHVFKMSASRTRTCFESHTPLVNGCVDDVLFSAAPNVQQTLSQFVNILNICLVDALLHCSPDFVIHRAHSIVTVALYCILSEIKRDIAQKLLFFHTPAFDAPVRGSPSEYYQNVWCRKTRMVRLRDGEKFLICLAVST